MCNSLGSHEVDISSKLPYSIFNIYYYPIFFIGLFLTIFFICLSFFDFFNGKLDGADFIDRVVVLSISLFILYGLFSFKRNLVRKAFLVGVNINIDKVSYALKDINYLREVIIFHNSFCWLNISGDNFIIPLANSLSSTPFAIHLSRDKFKNKNLIFLERRASKNM